MIEKWIAVKDFEGRYEVSTHGNVKSLLGRKDRLLRGGFSMDGYQTYLLLKEDGKSSVRKRINRLVLESFVGDAPTKEHMSLHNDGDKFNNRLDNLRWGTRSENMLDCRKHGTDNRGIKHWNCILTEEQVRDIKIRLSNGETQKGIGEMYGVGQVTIWRIKAGKNWAHISI